MDLMLKSKKTTSDTEDLLPLREQMLLPLAVVGVCCFTPFVIFNLIRGNYFLGIGIFLATLVFIINGWEIIRRKRILVPFELLIFPAAVSIILSIRIQGVYGAFWCFPLLLFFYFVLSRRTANLSGVLLLVAVAYITFIYHGSDVMVRFAASLILLIVMANIIVGAIEDLHRRLLDQTIRDPLTGAYNRRYMEARLGEAVAKRRRKLGLSSILALDIDFFKRINDDFGHAAGDKVLKKIVELIQNRIRMSDKLFRIGGEEFLLFLPETNEMNAAVVAEDLRRQISEASLLNDRAVTVSIGISELGMEDSVDNWIKSADAALYRAKEGGRNRIERRDSDQSPPAETENERTSPEQIDADN